MFQQRLHAQSAQQVAVGRLGGELNLFTPSQRLLIKWFQRAHGFTTQEVDVNITRLGSGNNGNLNSLCAVHPTRGTHRLKPNSRMLVGGQCFQQ